MNIDKEELKTRFKRKDWQYVFKDAESISDYIISRNFRIFDPDIKADMKQECLLNFWKKVTQNKCDPEKNVFAFIWRNSHFRILEMLRKEKKRNSIARFFPLEDGLDDYLFFQKGVGEKYVPEELKEVWESK